jgi:hypothetical protein
MAGNEAKKNIYAKMAAVKVKTLGLKKSGQAKTDKYGFAYFELGDILQVLIPALYEEGLHMETQFAVDGSTAKLKITDIDAREDTIEFAMPVAEFRPANMSAIQALGAAQTYTRRYLLMTAFDIAETDQIDGNPQTAEPQKEKRSSDTGHPQTVYGHPRKDKRPADTGNPEGADGNGAATDPEVTRLKKEIWAIVQNWDEEKRESFIEQLQGASKSRLEAVLTSLKPAKEEVDIF